MASVSNTQKALKGMSSQTLVTIMLGVVEVISFSIMSRLLTAEDFGYYAAITAITAVFSSFSETGMGASIIQRKELTERFVNNAFTISCIVGALAASLLIILAKPLSNGLVDGTLMIPLMLMSVTLLFHNVTSVNISLMHRRLEFLKVGSIQLISLVITTIVAIILAYLGHGYYAILTKAILSSVITLILTYIGAKTHFHFQLDLDTFKQIFSFSGWLMASVFFRNLALQMDRLLMSRILSVEALGMYNRPKEFINQISSKLNGIFDTALFPVLSGIQDNIPRIRGAYLRSFYYMNIFALVLSMSFIFNSELIIRIFFGTKWLHLVLTTQILSCALIFNIDGRLADCYLRSLGWTKQQFYFRIFEVAMKLAGISVGARWGINGVAVSVVSVNFLTIVAKNYYICSRIGINQNQILRSVLSSWRFSLFVLPIVLISYILLPHTILGNIVLLSICCVCLFIAFVLCPSIVGKKYREEAYVQVKIAVLNKLHLENNI